MDFSTDDSSTISDYFNHSNQTIVNENKTIQENQKPQFISKRKIPIEKNAEFVGSRNRNLNFSLEPTSLTTLKRKLPYDSSLTVKEPKLKNDF